MLWENLRPLAPSYGCKNYIKLKYNICSLQNLTRIKILLISKQMPGIFYYPYIYIVTKKKQKN